MPGVTKASGKKKATSRIVLRFRCTYEGCALRFRYKADLEAHGHPIRVIQPGLAFELDLMKVEGAHGQADRAAAAIAELRSKYPDTDFEFIPLSMGVSGGSAMTANLLALAKITGNALRLLNDFYRRRQENLQQPRVNNSELPAGSPMYYYCHTCGGLAAVLDESHRVPAPRHCKECTPLVTEGLIK